MEALRQEIVTQIRSVLTSLKGQCTMQQLKSDYHMFMGCDIPYRKLKFDTLEAFLRSEASLECRPGPAGLVINAKLTEKSAHIARMVAVQKDAGSRKPRRTVARFGRRIGARPMNNYNHNYNNRGHRGRYAENHYNYNRPGPGPQTGAVRRQVPPPRRSPPLVNHNNNNYDKRDLKIYNNRNTNTAPATTNHVNHNPPESKPPLIPPLIPKTQTAHSNKTNRSMLLSQQGNSISPNTLKNESLKAFDPHSSVWAFSSSESSGEESSKSKLRQQFERSDNAIADLQKLLMLHHHPPPEVTILKRQLKPHKPQKFDCKIVAAGKTFSNYPKDFMNDKLVEIYTSEKALEELIPILQSSIPTASLLISDNNDVLERVPPMVEHHANGIWNEQLERLYSDKYRETLPLNWLKVIENSPVISIQQASKTLHLLTYCKPEDKGKLSEQQKTRLEEYIHSTVSVAANQIRLEEGVIISVELLCAESAGEVWFRMVGTDEGNAVDELVESMSRHYRDARLLNQTERPERIVAGGHYVVMFNDIACRVQALKMPDSDGDVLCFYIDYGDAQEVQSSEVYTLKEEFASIQAQAFQCRLAGLEDLYDSSGDYDSISRLVGHYFNLELAPESSATPGEPLNVVLYDTENDVVINEVLHTQLLIETAKPVLNDSLITDVIVTNVERNGEIFVHLTPYTPGFEKLMELQCKFNEALASGESWITTMPVISKETCGNDKIFISKCSKDDKFYRAQVNDWEPKGCFVQVLFIDMGYKEIIKTSDAKFYEVAQFSDFLEEFAAQALLIKLDLEEVPENFCDIFYEIVGTSSILAKLVQLNEENVPIVKLFKRVLPDNLLASINETITMKIEKKPDRPTKLDLLKTTNKNPPSAGELKTPDIPTIDSFFDVNVPNASSPWNFFIQPWDSLGKLESIMQLMQEEYKDAQYSPLSMDDIIPGKIYASKHPESGIWHRTSVMKVINPESISVYHVDYGYYCNLRSNQLLPLKPTYLDLPYQAIKAKLSGVKPKNNKWTMADCALFRKLVTGKSFVSIVQRTETDEFCPSDIVLCLRLVNTSGEEDIHIGEVLIQKNIAVIVEKTV